MAEMTRSVRVWRIVGPGILVAATGVGAGDLATGAFAGSHLGTAVLWACLVGAFLKYVLNEGLARWQLVSGTTFLEGIVRHLGRPVAYLFLIYLLGWSFFVGSALMGACGVTAHALWPLFSADFDKILYGMLQSAFAVGLIFLGGYRFFEYVMRFCIAMMFFAVVLAAVASRPLAVELLSGLFVPRIPAVPESWSWTIALMGGVGGTLTIVCYGYWIREEGRTSYDQLTACRWDLASGYTVTALFGISMVIIGSQVSVEGTGSTLVVNLAHQLQTAVGTAGSFISWVFLIGAWSAVFSSLLGVWQSVPYIFADLCRIMSAPGSDQATTPVCKSSWPYRIYLLALATVPAIGLQYSFQHVQKTYAIIGACFLPLLAVSLLWLNGWSGLLDRKYKNSHVTNIILVFVAVFFVYYGWIEVQYRLGG